MRSLSLLIALFLRLKTSAADRVCVVDRSEPAPPTALRKKKLHPASLLRLHSRGQTKNLTPIPPSLKTSALLSSPESPFYNRAHALPPRPTPDAVPQGFQLGPSTADRRRLWANVVLNTPSLSHHQPNDGGAGWWDFGQGSTRVGKAYDSESVGTAAGQGRGKGAGLREDEGGGRGKAIVGGLSRGGKRS